MKKTSGLELRKFSLEKDCEELEKNLQIYKKKEQDHAIYNESYDVAVDLVSKTLVEGVTSDEINSIFNTVIDNKFYLSIPEFVNDIETYGGIKSAIFKTRRELETLERLRREQEDLIDSSEI